MPAGYCNLRPALHCDRTRIIFHGTGQFTEFKIKTATGERELTMGFTGKDGEMGDIRSDGLSGFHKLLH
jgi:hypothetical protein